MDDLIAFVKARLDEKGLEAARGWPRADVLRDYYAAAPEGWPHGPGRSLSELVAIRAIISEYENASEPGYRAGLLFAVRAHAAAYSDHPDYRAEWKP